MVVRCWFSPPEARIKASRRGSTRAELWGAVYAADLRVLVGHPVALSAKRRLSGGWSG